MSASEQFSRMRDRLSVGEVGCVAVGALTAVLLVTVGVGSLLVPVAAAYPVAAGLAWVLAIRERRGADEGLRLGLPVATVTLAATLPVTVLPRVVGGVNVTVADLAWNQLAVVHIQLVAPAALLFAAGSATTTRGRVVTVGLLLAVLGAVLARQLLTGQWAAPRFMWPDLLETAVAYGVAAAVGLPMVPLARHLPVVARRRAQGVSGAAE